MVDWDMIAFFFFAVVALAIIGISANELMQKVIDYKKSKLAAGAGEAGRGDILAERTAHIEDRLRVLERLATDRGALLTDEIEALRDHSPVSSRETA